jgi:hypothetical protein
MAKNPKQCGCFRALFVPVFLQLFDQGPNVFLRQWPVTLESFGQYPLRDAYTLLNPVDALRSF